MTAQQLKISILQMAVQGKLVPQDPNDEPASVLLERIRKEKEQLIKEGKIKLEKNPSVIFRGADNTPYEKIGNAEPISIADKAPYEIPDSWEWCRVGDLFSTMSGLAYKKEALNKKTNSMIRVLRGGNISDENYSFKLDDVFISSEFVKPELYLRKNYMITPAVSSLEHIGKIALIDKDYDDVVVGGFVLMLLPVFNDDVVSRYLLYAFSAKHHRDNCRNITHKSGQAFYNISRELLLNLPVPIPPINEMQRIVEQLDLIMPFISSYGQLEDNLFKLNNSFPEQLKKSILQMAVQGKLVPQDPNDEPTSVLLEGIHAEKERLIKEGKIKRDKNESVIFRRDNSHYEKLGKNVACIDGELPFEIPDSWGWARLGSIVYNRGQQTPEVNFCYIDIGSIDNENQRLNTNETVLSPEEAPSRARKIVDLGDILYSTVRPYLHNMCIINRQFNHTPIASTGFAAMTCHTGIFNKYLFYYLMSPPFDLYANDTENSKGVAYPAINDARLYHALIPIPPENEQNRIVEHIEAILPLVKSL